MDEKDIDAANALAREKLGARADKLAAALVPQSAAPADDRPQIEGAKDTVPIELTREGRLLSEFADELGKIAASAEIFDQNGNVVVVDKRRGLIELMTPDVFRSWIETVAVPYKLKTNPRKGPEEPEFLKIRKSVPRDLSAGTLVSDFFKKHLRRLLKVNRVPLPIKRADGRIELLSQGYDDESGIYTLAPEGVKISDYTLDESKAVLDDLLKEFPFTDVDETGQSRSKSVQIAAMLSLFTAGLLPANAYRLSTMWTANSQRSGKSLLAKIAITPVCGLAEVKSLPSSPEETRKILDAAALSAAPYLLFDDLFGYIQNQDLNAFMTADVWSGRLLNSQRTFQTERVSLVFLTGNQLKLSPDLANRVLICELAVEFADFQAREIKNVIDSQTLNSPAMRSRVLSALWGLVRHWDATGRKAGGKRLAGFEHYCDVVGGIVIAAGYGDPCAKPTLDAGGDEQSRDMETLIRLLYDHREPAKLSNDGREYVYTFAEIARFCWQNELFSWFLQGKEYETRDGEMRVELSPSSTSTLGKLLKSNVGKKYRLSDDVVIKFSRRGVKNKTYPITILRA